MSRLARNPIPFDSNMKVAIEENVINFEGKLGKSSLKIPNDINVKLVENSVKVDGENKALVGTIYACIKNEVIGNTSGFEKKLELVGTGYKANVSGNTLVLSLGFSHDINFPIPDSIKISVEKNTSITISGSNKQLVGQVAAKIRSYRKPEPYKGKGVKYSDEKIIRKEGKKK